MLVTVFCKKKTKPQKRGLQAKEKEKAKIRVKDG